MVGLTSLISVRNTNWFIVVGENLRALFRGGVTLEDDYPSVTFGDNFTSVVVSESKRNEAGMF
jgi:hypothetical protein